MARVQVSHGGGEPRILEARLRVSLGGVGTTI